MKFPPSKLYQCRYFRINANSFETEYILYLEAQAILDLLLVRGNLIY
jgi:hypothetical protein